MKNQYFGDINDYFKYGLLRGLSGEDRTRIAVCWMRTPDDGRRDGGRIQYLERPDRWRRFDPELYDRLRRLVCVRRVRDVWALEDTDLLETAQFYGEVLPDDARARGQYFQGLLKAVSGSDLVFLDPDNGIEVPSTPYGRKGSSKYLYWREIETAFGRGHSLLIYQHVPRRPVAKFTRTISDELAERTGAMEIYVFRTPRVVFLLVPQKRHRDRLARACGRVLDRWSPHMELDRHVRASMKCTFPERAFTERASADRASTEQASTGRVAADRSTGLSARRGGQA
jgi:hypothetical protein